MAKIGISWSIDVGKRWRTTRGGRGFGRGFIYSEPSFADCVFSLGNLGINIVWMQNLPLPTSLQALKKNQLENNPQEIFATQFEPCLGRYPQMNI
jgi:hypothetical protein